MTKSRSLRKENLSLMRQLPADKRRVRLEERKERAVA